MRDATGKLTAEYNVWRGMKQRCLQPNNPQFQHYGGRGIHICSAWVDSYKQFLHDMGRRPSSKHSIERRDNDGPYNKDNCIWATMLEQNRNQRRTCRLEYKGKIYILTDLAAEVGLDHGTIQSRLRRGWSVDCAVETPPTPSPAKLYLYKGKGYTLAELAKLTGFKKRTLEARARLGWDVERMVERPRNGELPPRKMSHKKKGSKYWHPPIYLSTS